MKKESIAVIGAGIGGITTAIVLAKAGYDVTLIEKAKDVSLGASALPGRLQVGGLYVGEYATRGTANAGKQCVDAAIAFKQMYQGDVWAEDKGACFSQALREINSSLGGSPLYRQKLRQAPDATYEAMKQQLDEILQFI